MKVSKISNTSDINFVFPRSRLFFEPYLQYFIKEILETDGEPYIARTSEGAVSGMFIYGSSEKVGTIHTRTSGGF